MKFEFIFRRMLQVPAAAREFLIAMKDQHGAEYSIEVSEMTDEQVQEVAHELIEGILSQAEEPA